MNVCNKCTHNILRLCEQERVCVCIMKHHRDEILNYEYSGIRTDINYHNVDVITIEALSMHF